MARVQQPPYKFFKGLKRKWKNFKSKVKDKFKSKYKEQLQQNMAAADARYNQMMGQYESFEFDQVANPYADVSLGDPAANPYSGMSVSRGVNPYEDIEIQPIENAFEDLTVRSEATELAQQGLATQQADVLAGLQGAAGGAGVASLAQALTRQAAASQQRATAGMAQQRSQLDLRAAGAQQDIAQQQAARQMQLDMSRAGAQRQMDESFTGRQMQLGLAEAGAQRQMDEARLGREFQLGLAGAQFAGQEAQAQRDFDVTRMQTMLGMAMEQRAAAYGADSQRRADNKNLVGNIVQGLGNAASAFSDRRLKKNVKYIKTSKEGIPVYEFEYISKSYGEGVYQGAMSNEVPSYAVSKDERGYDMVDYSKIDVDFKKIK